VNAKGETETLDEDNDTGEKAINNLEYSVDGMVNLLEEYSLNIRLGTESRQGYIQ